jgi:thioesterase domain-containing protein
LEMARRLKQAGERIGTLMLIDAHYSATRESGLPSRRDAGMLNSSKESFWRYVTVGRRYTPGLCPDKVTLLCPSERPFPTFDQVTPWQAITRDLVVRWLPGGHKTCLTKHVRSLGAALTECLASAMQQ